MNEPDTRNDKPELASTIVPSKVPFTVPVAGVVNDVKDVGVTLELETLIFSVPELSERSNAPVWILLPVAE